MKRYLINPIRVILDYIVYCFDFDPFMIKSYSQEGEDMILRRIFENHRQGFYIDIGAHHPQRFSNTFIFYKRGWSGMNIDAMPGSMKLFKRIRPRDINLEIPIAKKQETLTYIQFEEPALNTFDENLAQHREKAYSYRIIARQKLEAYPLKNILEKYLDKHQSIDILSIDVEGLDLQVLESNDWLNFRPKVILVEILNSSLNTVIEDSVYKFLTSENYHIYAKAVNTVFFMSDEFFGQKLKIARDINSTQK